MRVVVTGASGFVGRWLVRHLRARSDHVCAWIHGVDHNFQPSGVSVRVQDITDATGCARAMAEDTPDALVHLAAIAHQGDAAADPTRAFAVNVQGTHNVFAALPTTARAVLVSSCLVYGPPRRLPIDEDHVLAPQTVYARTKRAAEDAARAVFPDVICARPFHHTGPGQAPHYVLAEWAAQLSRGGPVSVGDLTARRDFSDVRDIVAGYRVLLRRGAPGATYNLCSGIAWPLRTLLAEMNHGTLPTVYPDPRRGRAQIAELRGDPRRAQALGWRAKHDIRQTVREMLTPPR